MKGVEGLQRLGLPSHPPPPGPISIGMRSRGQYASRPRNANLRSLAGSLQLLPVRPRLLRGCSKLQTAAKATCSGEWGAGLAPGPSLGIREQMQQGAGLWPQPPHGARSLGFLCPYLVFRQIDLAHPSCPQPSSSPMKRFLMYLFLLLPKIICILTQGGHFIHSSTIPCTTTCQVLY